MRKRPKGLKYKLHKENPTSFKKGCVPWNKGLKGFGKEFGFQKGNTLGKLSKGRIGIKPSKETIRKILRRRPMSGLEQKVQNVITKYNLPYKFVGNGKFFIERKNPDFININGEKTAVEVYCRKHKENIRKLSVDNWKKERQEIFSKYGWSIIFIEDWQTNKEKTIISLLKGGS